MLFRMLLNIKFNLIFNVLQTLAKHVMNLHANALQMTEDTRPGELHLNTLKKYIAFCRRSFKCLFICFAKARPRLYLVALI